MKSGWILTLLTGLALTQPAQLGPRPLYLLDSLEPGPLKTRLAACAARTEAYPRSPLAIGHRGAALFFPEHTREGYLAADRRRLTRGLHAAGAGLPAEL
ncbi:hypothetical protein [Oceanithermus sp.]